jgi:glycosyltransferase involved in cell wall biosynthesis
MNPSKNTPLLSVVVPAYQAERHLADALKSILSQSLGDLEVIIIDDGSTDGTKHVIEHHIQSDNRVHSIHNAQNLGAAATRNAGISAAQGRYIAFLDADDLWLPGKIEAQLTFMEAQRAAFTCTAYQVLDANGQIRGDVVPPSRAKREDLLKTSSVGCSTVIYDTGKLGKVFMPNIRKRQDFGLWLRLLRMTDEVHGLKDIFVQYRTGFESLSSNKISAARYQWDVYRNVEKLSFLQSSYYFAFYAYAGMKKHHRLAKQTSNNKI